MIEACRATASYKPDPRGQRGARDSIATYYREAGISLLPENVLLTPGTSTAYQYCFQTVADRGDEILCPQPSYPLFEYIAELCGVRMVPYRHVEARGWAIDLDFLEASVSTATRAIVLISPHNPTGYVARKYELLQIAEIARRHDLAIVSDEVFGEFVFDGSRLPRIAAQDAPLVFTLNGFSKMFALPGIKLSWMGLTGDNKRVEKAMGCLELISDTYLSVSEIAQALTSRLFREGRQFLTEYQHEIGRRRSLAIGILRNCSRLHFVEPEGGVLPDPATGRLRRQSCRNSPEKGPPARASRTLLRPGTRSSDPQFCPRANPSRNGVTTVGTNCGRALTQGAQRSISTRMSFHLPCRNLKNDRTARAKWPRTIANQTSLGSRPRSPCTMPQYDRGIPICETRVM